MKITYWDKQRYGNYQIKVNRKSDMLAFNDYVKEVLIPLDDKVKDYYSEPHRRYYVQQEHIDHMMLDNEINLVPAYVWNENKGGNK